MKAIQLLLLIIFVCSYSASSAQISSADDWNTDRLEREHKAMRVLMIWGSTNLGLGVVGTFTSKEEDVQWFSSVNAGFGAVNLALGWIGVNRTQKQLKSLPSLDAGYRDLRKTRNILLVNAGLDVGYIVTGILVRDEVFRGFGYRRINLGPASQRGFGSSLILQGAALLIFDSVTAWSLSKSEIHISPVLTPNGAGLGFQSDFSKKQPQGVAWF